MTQQTTAGRKRIYASFSRALRNQGFTFEVDSFLSFDKRVQIDFFGRDWTVSIDNKPIFTYETITGSMQKLRHVLSTHNMLSSLQKTVVTVFDVKEQKVGTKEQQSEYIKDIINDII